MPPSPRPRPRALCLTFDAFGTLFHPRQPIAAQYAHVAREHGLSGFTDEEMGRKFKDGACVSLFPQVDCCVIALTRVGRAAYKDESKKHPNYGRAVGMGPEQWWANVRAHLYPA